MARAEAQVLYQLLCGKQGRRRVLQKPVAATTGPAPHITGEDPDRTLLLCGETRWDQTTAAIRTLHHHQSAGKTDQKAVPGSKVTWLNVLPRLVLTQKQTVASNVHLQGLVMPRINTIKRCAQHS